MSNSLVQRPLNVLGKTVMLLAICSITSYGETQENVMAKQLPGLKREFGVRAGLGRGDVGLTADGYLHYIEIAGLAKERWTAHGADVSSTNTYRISSYGVSFPPLKIGDMVPIFGDLYQVTDLLKLSPLKSSEGKDVMRMTRLEKSPVEGIVVQPNSCAIPLRGDIGFIHYKVKFGIGVKKIAETEGGTLSADILIYRSGVYVQDAARVKVGDVLAVKEHAYKVLSIVPRDAEKGVIGWVEIDPEPMSEAELKKAKSIVRPVPSQPEAK